MSVREAVCVFVAWSLLLAAHGAGATQGPKISEAPVTRLMLGGPPWLPFLNEHQPHSGLATQIVSRALNEAGYQTDVRIKPWVRILQETQHGTIDVLIGLWYSEERAADFAYSHPYYLNEIHLIAPAGANHVFTQLEALKGYRIGVRPRAAYGAEFDAADFLTKVEVPALVNIMRMIDVGRLELGVGDAMIFRYLLSENPGLIGRLTLLNPPLSQTPLHMAVSRKRKDHAEVVQRFNQALTRMHHAGVLEEIYRQWGQESIPELVKAGLSAGQ